MIWNQSLSLWTSKFPSKSGSFGNNFRVKLSLLFWSFRVTVIFFPLGMSTRLNQIRSHSPLIDLKVLVRHDFVLCLWNCPSIPVATRSFGQLPAREKERAIHLSPVHRTLMSAMSFDSTDRENVSYTFASIFLIYAELDFKKFQTIVCMHGIAMIILIMQFFSENSIILRLCCCSNNLFSVNT